MPIEVYDGGCPERIKVVQGEGRRVSAGEMPVCFWYMQEGVGFRANHIRPGAERQAVEETFDMGRREIWVPDGHLHMILTYGNKSKRVYTQTCVGTYKELLEIARWFSQPIVSFEVRLRAHIPVEVPVFEYKEPLLTQVLELSRYDREDVI